MSELRIAGLTRFSTVDWPERLAATVFLQGCPWDCFYCHNPALIDPRAPGRISWSEVESFLRRRSGLLDAVVFSGGEPSMQRALVPAMHAARGLGYRIGLHSAGAFPGLLARALEETDWIGLDVKALPEDYAALTGRARSGEHAWESLRLVLAENRRRDGSARPLDYEIRTTVHPAAIGEDGLARLGARLADMGVEHWAVQRFRPAGVREVMPGHGELDLPPGHETPRALDLECLPRERFARLTVRSGDWAVPDRLS